MHLGQEEEELACRLLPGWSENIATKDVEMERASKAHRKRIESIEHSRNTQPGFFLGALTIWAQQLIWSERKVRQI